MDKFIIISALLINLKSANSVNCPSACKCSWQLDHLAADCSGQLLHELPDFSDLPIENLDLSGNLFTEFPSELSHIESLATLNLQGNMISRLGANALSGFNTLHWLILDNNNISVWSDINPHRILLPVNDIKVLSLAGNPLTGFSTTDDRYYLRSNSLSYLDLRNCKLTKISGKQFLRDLPNLETLMLGGNSLKTLSPLQSDTLRNLDLSSTDLVALPVDSFVDLPQLQSLDLSRNPGLSLVTPQGEYVKSDSVKRLDLSYCNIDSIDVSEFPALNHLVLKGNMIRRLTSNSFTNNEMLENLDLSNNALQVVGAEAFSNLLGLKRLDLSFNTISKIEINTFKDNEQLTMLDVSRNFITKFNKIIAPSLIKLNLSGCEILKIDRNALEGAKNLLELDLSYNLFSELPPRMICDTLQILDLSMCRLSTIRNATFQAFPELHTLKLSGNRITSPFRRDFFRYNPYLNNIWLGDNPWRCDCLDPLFYDFYRYLTDHPTRVKDRQHLRCASPDIYYGQGWESACFSSWFSEGKTASVEKVWTVIMVSIIVFTVVLFFVSCLKRYIDKRKRRHNDRDLRRNLEEHRRIMRDNIRMLEQEAQLNAPDPRESNPPCYEDALQMPRLQNSKSMVELGPRKSKRKGKSDVDEADGGLILDHQRFRSEELLSVRDNERTININATRRTGDFLRNHSLSRLLSAEDSRFPASFMKAQNLESAEKIANFQSYENSPYSKRRPKLPLDDVISLSSSNDLRTRPLLKQVAKKKFNSSDSVEVIASFESVQKSPYSQRKPKIKTNFPNSVSQTAIPTSEEPIAPQQFQSDLQIYDDFYSRNGSSTTSSSSGFQLMNSEDAGIVSVHSSKSSGIHVIVHRQNNDESRV